MAKKLESYKVELMLVKESGSMDLVGLLQDKVLLNRMLEVMDGLGPEVSRTGLLEEMEVLKP